MTPQERAILQEAEDQAFETSQQLYNPLSSGIRPPPSIEETESSLEGQLFGLEFGAEPHAQSFPGAGVPLPPPPTCPSAGVATIDITIASLSLCSPYSDIDMNGIFTLTNFESGGWSGNGGTFDDGTGAQQAYILVTCMSGILNVVYSGATDFTEPQFFVGVGSPPAINNGFASCSDGAGFGGTATIS